MIFKDIYPSRPLQEFVKLYRLRHFIIPPVIKIYPKSYPAQPEQCFIFYPRGAEKVEILGSAPLIRSRSVIAGQYTCRMERSSVFSEIIFIVVVLKPGILFRLTGIPSVELNDKTIELEVVFPKDARLVNGLLNSASSYEEMIMIIENFLLDISQRIKVEARVCDKIFSIMADPQNYSIDQLSSKSCLSSRQFERKSFQYLGVNPKFYTRIARFNKTYQMRLKNPDLDWLSIAMACGYYDYQHLVKDYLEFANDTPKLFFQDEYKSLERLLKINV
ncbi:AraC family transcriptional regulator [Christiangramia fulva]|uniref:AraC family transcriptional regulator n=1 Tax=Christiangramia fulva TaxID=2126553 RepID=A0A2R3Z2I4_9FLAO|nr:AraC family transcriptional regulator [Christiangramia fulva]AVR44455.1 AraC family transcriptional regulator [Christiangramia fulva]